MNLILDKAGREYRLRTADQQVLGSFRAHWSMYGGELRVGGDHWGIHMTDRGYRGLVVGSDEDPVVRLHPQGSVLPGGSAADWQLTRRRGRYRGVLRRGNDVVSAQRSPFSGERVAIEASGSWSALEVLAVAYAVLARRRHDVLAIAAVAAATSHGPR